MFMWTRKQKNEKLRLSGGSQLFFLFKRFTRDGVYSFVLFDSIRVDIECISNAIVESVVWKK
jgi:hypothetical protein